MSLIKKHWKYAIVVLLCVVLLGIFKFYSASESPETRNCLRAP